MNISLALVLMVIAKAEAPPSTIVECPGRLTELVDTLYPRLFLLGNDDLGVVVSLESLNGFVIVSDPLGDSRVVVLSLADGRRVTGYGRSGDGPGEYHMPLLSGTDRQNTLWLYDSRAPKIDELHLADGTISLVDSHRLVLEGGRFQRIVKGEKGAVGVLGSGQPTIVFMDGDWDYVATAKLPIIEGLNLSTPGAVPAAGSAIAILPGSDWKVVVAYQRVNRIDLVSGVDQSVETVRGPRDVTVQWEPLRGTSAESEYAYVDVDATHTHVYALFSGTTARSGSSIHIFDIAGRFIGEILLGAQVSGIVVNPSENVILGAVSDPAPGIAVFDLPHRFR